MFGLASELVEDLTVSIDKECLFFRCYDPSHVCMLDLVMPNTVFEKWDVKKEGDFALRVDELFKLFKTFDKKDSVTLKLENSMLNVSTKTTQTKIRLIKSTLVDLPLPMISYNALVSIESKAFKNAVKRISLVSEYLTFEACGHLFNLSGKGDSGESKITFEKGMEDLPEIDVKENSISTYSLEYINAFIKHVTDGRITLEYANRMPLRIEVRPTNYYKIHFYLAPRVEN